MTVVFAFFFMLLIVAAMAVGVIMGRKPIAGSCGGIKALGLDAECEVCGGNPAACSTADRRPPRNRAGQAGAAALSSNAATGASDTRTL